MAKITPLELIYGRKRNKRLQMNEIALKKLNGEWKCGNIKSSSTINKN